MKIEQMGIADMVALHGHLKEEVENYHNILAWAEEQDDTDIEDVSDMYDACHAVMRKIESRIKEIVKSNV